MARTINDKDILDFASETFRDVMSPQQARVWAGTFVLSWDNPRIAKALGIDTKTVRSTLYVARRIIFENPDIAYRSINLTD